MEQVQHDHEVIIGSIMLRSSIEDLRRIEQLPDALDRIGLHQSRLALLYALGCEDILRAEGAIIDDEGVEIVQEHFESWLAAGIDSAPLSPDFLLEDDVVLASRVLGCNVQVSCPNNLMSIGIAEAVLGALEALLATSLGHRVFPHLEKFRIRVSPSEAVGIKPTLTFVEEFGETVAIIEHAVEMVYKNREEALIFPNWIKDSVVVLLLKFIIPADVDQWAKSVFGDENGFGRAATFSDVPSMLSHVLGQKHRLSIGDWLREDDRHYSLKRLQQWSPVKPRSREEERLKNPRPEDYSDFENRKHTDFEVFSPIDMNKWNEANWSAAMFVVVPGEDDFPPVLALGFKNREAAISIFEQWRARYGNVDSNNELRISIVRGTSALNRFSYTISVGPNLEKASLETGKIFQVVSRLLQMQPSSSENLERFLSEFSRQKRFLLAPAYLPDGGSEPEALMDFGLGKYEIAIKEAWQVGENDPDIIVLDPDDPPIIPPDQPNAPALSALAHKRHRRRPEREVDGDR